MNAQMPPRVNSALSALTAVFFLCVSCNGITRSVRETLNPVEDTAGTTAGPRPEKNIEGFLTNAEALAKAEETFRNLPEFKGREPQLYNAVHFYDTGRIHLKVQHPENPAYIDEYKYHDGSWDKPVPVRMSVNEDIQTRLLPMNRIHFSTAAKVIGNLNKKSETIEGAPVITHTYAILSSAGDISWYPQTIDGSRERYSIRFNPDGSVKSFERE